jgi:non-ribosomal peptide synthetase component E (peptide arylation enzyme)
MIIQYASNSITITPSKYSGNYMYHVLQHINILNFAHRVYLCVLYVSHNTHKLFPLYSRNGLILVMGKAVFSVF